MIRIQLHLTASQDQRLRALARRAGRTRAALIRRGIELLLRDSGLGDDPLLQLVGAAGPAGRGDVSERHDELLYVTDGE